LPRGWRPDDRGVARTPLRATSTSGFPSECG
jgi:hypothetical protein